MGKEDPLYQQLAQLVEARRNCRDDVSGNPMRHEWARKHEDRIAELVRENLPHGSGFDNGTKIDLPRSTPERLVFTTAFHHMNEHGYYDGWTEHTVTVRPSLAHEFTLTITGPNRRDIKEYIHEAFHQDLGSVPCEPRKRATTDEGEASA